MAGDVHDFYHGECIGGHLDGQTYRSLVPIVEVIEQEPPCVDVPPEGPFYLPPCKVVGHYRWRSGCWVWCPLDKGD